MAQQNQINVDLSAAQDIVCENCGNYTFEEVLLMKKLSALLSPNGKETIIPIPTFSCNACGNINKQFLPTSMRGEESRIESEETVRDTTPKLKLEL